MFDLGEMVSRRSGVLIARVWVRCDSMMKLNMPTVEWFSGRRFETPSELQEAYSYHIYSSRSSPPPPLPEYLVVSLRGTDSFIYPRSNTWTVPPIPLASTIDFQIAIRWRSWTPHFISQHTQHLDGSIHKVLNPWSFSFVFKVMVQIYRVVKMENLSEGGRHYFYKGYDWLISRMSKGKISSIRR